MGPPITPGRDLLPGTVTDHRKPEAMTRHCCETMSRQVNVRCGQHDDPFDCPDALVRFSAKFQEYGLMVHDGGTPCVGIEFCPWCGHRLPASRREQWFDELERRGIDPWEEVVPEEFEDDRWLAALPQD
jgi:hypothetical protein